MPGRRERFDPNLLDLEDPFEIDDANRPHLYSHANFSEDDILDVWSSDWRFFPAGEDGDADWFIVARVPGRLCLCVPVAPPRSGDHRRCRPIGVYRASVNLERMYDDALREGE
jgi:hypothetical protein